MTYICERSMGQIIEKKSQPYNMSSYSNLYNVCTIIYRQLVNIFVE